MFGKTFKDSLSLLSHVRDSELYVALVQQLKKDFARANISIDLSVVSGIVELERSIVEKIYVLVLERYTDFLNLLYFVDVPEKDLEDLSSEDAVDYSKGITFLILKREWQKVFF